MSGKKMYTFAICTLSIVIVLIFAYAKPILTAVAFFMLLAIVVVLFSVYGFTKGIVLLIASDRLLRYYRFRLGVLKNNSTVPMSSGFVTSQLNEIEQKLQDANQKETQLRLSHEQQIITSFTAISPQTDDENNHKHFPLEYEEDK